MKRHAALAHLSSDHHDALRLARALEDAGREGGAAVTRALGKLAVTWKGELQGHFAWEERWFGRVLADTPTLAQLLAEHWLLRQHIEPLISGALGDGTSGPAPQRELAHRVGHLGTLLRAHVRWEERVLLPEVERSASAEDLAQMAASTQHPPSGF